MASRAPIPSPVWGCQRTALSRGPGQERPPPRLGRGPLRQRTSAAARALSNNGPRPAGKEMTRTARRTRTRLTKRDGGMNLTCELGEPASQVAGAAGGPKRAGRPVRRAGTRNPNQSDGRHYEPCGPGMPRGSPHPHAQHKTAPGWGGPGLIGKHSPTGQRGKCHVVAHCAQRDPARVKVLRTPRD